MSWDWTVQANECAACNRGDFVADRNVTYNLSAIFIEALGCSVRDLDGEEMRTVAARAREGLARMRSDPARFRALEPLNRWGTYESALRDLEWLTCYDLENARLRIS